MPCGRAAASIAAAKASRPGPRSSVSTTAAPTPACAASAINPGTIAAGAVTMARSGTQARSRRRATVAMPSMVRWFGLIQPILPA